MKTSDSKRLGLDLERDLPTSVADVEALRRHRPKCSFKMLASLDELNPPSWLQEPDHRRRVFGDWPPFEL